MRLCCCGLLLACLLGCCPGCPDYTQLRQPPDYEHMTDGATEGRPAAAAHR